MALTKIDDSMYEDISGANNLVKLDANAKIPTGSAANLITCQDLFKAQVILQ